MRRVPILPTLIVGLAVAAMIALGLWQLLDRLPQKEAYLAQLAANPARPVIAFPLFPDDSLLFRRTVADCRPPVAIRRAGAGAAGFPDRHLSGAARGDAGAIGHHARSARGQSLAGRSGDRLCFPCARRSFAASVGLRPSAAADAAGRRHPAPGLDANPRPGSAGYPTTIWPMPSNGSCSPPSPQLSMFWRSFGAIEWLW